MSSRDTSTPGGMPCANADDGDWQPVALTEVRRTVETPDSQPLTRYAAAFNALMPLCQHCDKVIPPERVVAAQRSKVEARWCSASCRVRGCVARKGR